jgi:hypothetical protein
VEKGEQNEINLIRGERERISVDGFERINFLRITQGQICFGNLLKIVVNIN